MTIRRVPTDFRVEEHADATFRESMRPAADSRTLHAIYRLEKTSLSTPEATARLAKALAIKPGDVAHAGLKDKHAFTIQHISAKARDLAGAFLFSGDEQEKQLWQLSGGERSRAVLAGLLASAKNLIVLDEPAVSNSSATRCGGSARASFRHWPSRAVSYACR